MLHWIHVCDCVIDGSKQLGSVCIGLGGECAVFFFG